MGPGVIGKWTTKEGSINGMLAVLAGQGTDQC